jgi:hypothetical protein
MPKDDQHIIDWILEQTDDIKQKATFRDRKRENSYENKKWSVDNSIFFCNTCKCCWSNQTRYIDNNKWKRYPKNLIPSIGKKRKECPHCEE